MILWVMFAWGGIFLWIGAETRDHFMIGVGGLMILPLILTAILDYRRL